LRLENTVSLSEEQTALALTLCSSARLVNMNGANRTVAGPSHLWRERHPLASRTLAIPVVLTLILDVASKSTANMAEVLWSCYWASALIAIGIMVDSELLVSAGFIFQAAVGGPAWTIGLIYGSDVQFPSLLLHIVPPLVGLLYVSGMAEIPKAAAAVIAWLVHPVSLFASLLWKDDQLNVNFSIAVWPPVARFFPLPLFQALLVLTSLLLVIAMAGLLDRWLCSRSNFATRKQI
jgi:hypothetical protein